MSNNENTIELETLLAITRQNLVNAVLINTELEALVQNLKKRIEELENSKKEK